MRTTLKRGVGRGHSGRTATARCSCRRARSARSRSTASRSRRRRSRRSLALSILGWAADGARRLRHGCRRWRVSLPARVGRRRRAARARREGDGEEARPPGRRRAGDGARDRLRPEGHRGQGHPVALGHADAHPGRPRQERDDLAALVPPRPPSRDHLPRAGDVHDQDQRRLRGLRVTRNARDGAQADRRPRSTT